MKKLSYFLMVGLAFIVLQVTPVAAQTGAPGAPMCDSNPACDPSDPAANCCAGMCDPNPACVMDDPNAIPCCGPVDRPPPGEDCANKPTPEETAACWDQQGGHMDHPGGPDGDHPPGEHHDGPPIDPRSGQPFAKADEAKFQKYADECEATKGVLSEGSTQELVAEGFTRIQVEKLCKDGPDHHAGPPGMPPQ